MDTTFWIAVAYVAAAVSLSVGLFVRTNRGAKYCYRWANEDGFAELPTPAELAADGWTAVRQHPRRPSSWLMRREID